MHRDDDADRLEAPESWEDEPFAIQEPREPSRAVVSVTFSREDFARIARHARDNGMTTSEFVRAAALGSLPEGASSAPIGDEPVANGRVGRDTITETPRSMRSRGAPNPERNAS